MTRVFLALLAAIVLPVFLRADEPVSTPAAVSAPVVEANAAASTEVAPVPANVKGKVVYVIPVREGIDNMPAAFLELFEGGNTGKMIVKF